MYLIYELRARLLLWVVKRLGSENGQKFHRRITCSAISASRCSTQNRVRGLFRLPNYLHPSKKGLSYWIGAARRIGDTYEEWEGRRKAPIVYLLKVATDAIHERLYYVLARTLNLPQQHVFWAMNPLYDDLIGVAIRFEQEAFFPRNIDPLAKIVTYRRKTYRVPNADDFLRHEVLHRYCGRGDIHQAMIKGEVLFGIDAADCLFHVPFLVQVGGAKWSLWSGLRAQRPGGER